jgi:hypothetical protein
MVIFQFTLCFTLLFTLTTKIGLTSKKITCRDVGTTQAFGEILQNKLDQKPQIRKVFIKNDCYGFMQYPLQLSLQGKINMEKPARP